jgi:alkylated DNA nucleotide flippase Atl1
MSWPIPGSRRVGSVEEAVLAAVSLIPPGRVMAYSDVAEFVGLKSGRTVGRILAGADDVDDEVPWHRVLRADGTMADHIRAEQMQRLRGEGVPINGLRVDMNNARWDGR